MDQEQRVKEEFHRVRQSNVSWGSTCDRTEKVRRPKRKTEKTEIVQVKEKENDHTSKMLYLRQTNRRQMGDIQPPRQSRRQADQSTRRAGYPTILLPKNDDNSR